MSNINKETKEKILEACVKTITDNGLKGLTLEKVAKAAGISKGGLLHHFKSKDDLIAGMLNYEMQQFGEVLNNLIANDRKKKGRNSRALINSLSFDLEATQIYSDALTSQKLWTSLLTCFAENPELLKPVKKDYEVWQEKIENDGIDKVDATIIRLATDGLLLAELFNFSPLNDEMRKKVLDKLLKMTE